VAIRFRLFCAVAAVRATGAVAALSVGSSLTIVLGKIFGEAILGLGASMSPSHRDSDLVSLLCL